MGTESHAVLIQQLQDVRIGRCYVMAALPLQAQPPSYNACTQLCPDLSPDAAVFFLEANNWSVCNPFDCVLRSAIVPIASVILRSLMEVDLT
jgi:hypothetical protein